MQIELVMSILGRFQCAYAAYMLMPALWAAITGDAATWPLFKAVSLTAAAGFMMVAAGQKEGSLAAREGFAIVTGTWVLASVFGALPFSLTGATPTYIDAIFETVSGLTTTGASVIDSLGKVPAPILLWRSMTHWLGGMGIIVLFIVLLPQLGVGAVHLFKAEVPGPITERVVPRIRETALALWKIYLLLTIAQIFMLMLAGMSFFDSLNHSFATLATGGFSTNDTSIKHYDSVIIEAIITFFMIVAGANFGLYYLAWRGGAKRVFADTEFRVYLAIIALSTLLITANLAMAMDQSIARAFRDALFQVASIITTTGFMSADFDKWPPFSKLILFLLMFIGGCAGSTAGAIKVSRLIILAKQSWAELRKAIHPRVVTSIHVDNKAIDSSVISSVSQFFFLYMMIFVLAVLYMTALGLEPFDAMGAVAGTLGNVGPGFGIVGPTTTYSSIAPSGKLVLSLCMLLGRLELFTMLVFLRAEFWRSRKGW